MSAPLLTLQGSPNWLSLPDLTVTTNHIIALHGESGAGKSRLLRAVADLDPNPLALSLNGQDRNDYAPEKWRQAVQYLPAEPVWWTDTAGAVINDDMSALAPALGLNPIRLQQPITQLSTGERQRCALLRALSVSPSVLLLDEPSAALDQSATEKLEAVLQNWVNAGERAIIWVSHNAAQREHIATQQWHIENGALFCQSFI